MTEPSQSDRPAPEPSQPDRPAPEPTGTEAPPGPPAPEPAPAERAADQAAAEPAAKRAIPPEPRAATQEPATREDGAPPVRRRRRWVRVVLVVTTVLLTIGGGALATGLYLVHRYTSGVHQENLLGSAAAGVNPSGSPTYVPITGPLNILLVGSDARAGKPSDGQRADSIIIAHIPAAHDRVYLVSIPRDSRVHIPAYPRTGYRGGTDKINAAFQFGSGPTLNRAGGFELLALTIKELTGISFNAGAIVDFGGFQSVVDAVGGVDLCVDEKTTSVHIGWDKNGNRASPYRLVPPDYHPVPIPGIRPQIYYPGCQHMSGWEALDYVRQRELIPDGDYGRERHQQQFLKALAAKVTSRGMLTHPLTLDSVLRATAGAVTFDGNGVSLVDWVYNLRDISASKVVMIKTNGGQFNTDVIGGQDFEILNDTSLELFAALRDDTVDSFVATHPTWVSGDGLP
jgi:LCP family protein required for cell wall assembly